MTTSRASRRDELDGGPTTQETYGDTVAAAPLESDCDGKRFRKLSHLRQIVAVGWRLIKRGALAAAGVARIPMGA